MENSAITDELKAWIGTTRPVRHGLISAHEIQKYCAAIGERDPIYTDEKTAKNKGFRTIIAPPLFPITAARPVPPETELLADGQYADLAAPGLQDYQTMLAGQEWEFFRPALVGETVTETLKILDLTERQGRAGTMIFQTEESVIASPAGPISRGTVTTILRKPSPAEASSAAKPKPQAPSASPAGQADIRRAQAGDEVSPLIKRPTMLSLFMFAAVSWAVHRIHYDAAYAATEGLPSPILVGTMQAAYACQLMEKWLAGQGHLRGLSIRYQALTYPGDELTCGARVKSRSRVDGADEIDVEYWIDNQDMVRTASGTAKLRLT